MRKQIHVTPRPDGNWQVIRPNAERASAVTETQKEAFSFARDMAKKEGAEVIISGENGKFRESNSYGNDPRNVKG